MLSPLRVESQALGVDEILNVNVQDLAGPWLVLTGPTPHSRGGVIIAERLLAATLGASQKPFKLGIKFSLKAVGVPLGPPRRPLFFFAYFLDSIWRKFDPS